MEESRLFEPEPKRIFLQGLIQLAAAYHHHGRGNQRGSAITARRRDSPAGALSGRSRGRCARRIARGGKAVGEDIE